MKMIFRYIAFCLFTLISIAYFLPKESIYFQIEKYLKTKEIIISDEQIEENSFGIVLKEGKLFFNKMSIANIESIKFNTYMFLTNIEAKDILLDESLSMYIPLKIDEIVIENSFFNFNKIRIKSNGNFGELSGNIDLFKNVLKIVLTPSVKMKKKSFLLEKMKKGEDEKYTYEYKF